VSRTERAFNVLLGLSVLSWAFLGLLHSLAVPQLVIAVLNAVVGVLLLLRSPLVQSGSVKALLLSLPSVAVAGCALKLSAPLEAWPWLAQAIFVIGGALTVASFLVLGRSFAILPALRSITTRGPYRVVRHPAYVGELVMVVACVVAGPSWATLAALAAAVPLVVLRIHVEERTLRDDERYEEYTRATRYRLMPGLW